VSKPSVYGAGGVKTQHDYCSDDGTLLVRKQFTYTPTGVNISFEWFDRNGEVGLTKGEFKPLSAVEVANLKKKNRDRTLMYLKSTAENTPAAQFVEAILSHYKYSIELWLLNGTAEWLMAMATEPEFEADGVTPNPIYQYLNIQTQIPNETYPNGITVKDGISYQITADE
jgi:hypothetical protein